MVSLAVWFCLLIQALGGSVTPDPTEWLAVTSSSAGRLARYLFRFTVSTQVLRSASVELTFPSEFVDGVVAGDPLCFQVTASASSNIPCSIASKKVSFQFSQLYLGSQTIGLWSVTNPPVPGPTGQFTLKTYINNLLLDSNLACPGLTITPPGSPMTATISVVGGQYPTDTSQYALKITVKSPVSTHIVRVTWPAEFETGQNGTGCVWNEANQAVPCVFVEPWSRLFEIRPIQVQTSMSFTIKNVKNPGWAGVTGNFGVEIVDSGSGKSSYWVAGVTGVNITPGTVDGLTLTYGNPYNDSLVWFTVKFTVRSPVPEGGRVTVSLPEPFQSCTDCAVITGLTPIPGKLICSTVNNSVFYQHFAPIAAATAITVRFQAKTPKSQSSASGISVGTDLGAAEKAIDIATIAQTIAFLPANPPEKVVNIDLFKAKSDTPIGAFGPFELYIQTHFSLSANTVSTSTDNRIEITCPVSIESSGNSETLVCFVGRKRLPASVCMLKSNLITITPPSAEGGLDCCPLSIVVTTSPGAVSGLRVNPAYPGLQQFTIRVYQHTLLEEEAVYYYSPAAKALTSPIGVAAPGSAAVTPVHFSAGMDNVVIVRLTLSVAMPSGSSVRFELNTDGFDSDFRGLSGNYPCGYRMATAGTFAQCSLIKGGTVRITFERFSHGITADSHTFYLSDIRNGPISGVFPIVIITTIAPDGTVTELYEYTADTPLSDAVVTVISPPGSSVVIANNEVSAVNVDCSVSFSLNSDLNPNDSIVISFPKEYIWPDFPNIATISMCKSGTTVGTATDYVLISNFDVNKVVFTTKTAIPQGISMICVQIPANNALLTASLVSVYVAQSQKVTFAGDLPVLPPVLVPIPPAANLSIAETLKHTSNHLISTKTVYEISFSVGKPLKTTNEIAIFFPESRFFASEFACYQLISAPNGTICDIKSAISYKSSVNSVVILASKSHDIPSGGVIIAQIWAKTNSGPGPVTISAAVFNPPLSDMTLWDEVNTVFTIDPTPVPADIAPYALLTPEIDLRVNEFGPISVKFQAKSDVCGSDISRKSYIKLIFPQTGGFVQAGGSFLDCRFDGVLSGLCAFDPSDAKSLLIYTPTDPSFCLLSSAPHELVITTKAANIEAEIGFKAPGIPGNYQFVIELYTDPAGVLTERTEIWVEIPPPRLYEASIQSISKGAGQWNVLLIDLKTPVGVNSSINGTNKGSMWIAFQSDAWRSDYLIENGIDCVDFGSVLTSVGQLKCEISTFSDRLFYVKMTGFDSVAVGDRFRFFLGPVRNPGNPSVDFSIKVALKEENLSDVRNPTWTSKAETTVSYIDTTMTVSPIVTLDPFPSNNKFQSSPKVAQTGQTLILHVANTVQMQTGDRILVKFDSDFGLKNGLVCSVTPSGGPTTPVSECIGMQRTGWVLVTLPAVLPASSPHVLSIQGVSLPPYSSVISPSSYYYIDRKLVEIVHHPDFRSFGNGIVPGGCALTTSLLDSQLQGYADTYSFWFICEHPILARGSIVLYFPPVEYAGRILEKTCEVGPKSGISILSLACKLINTAQVHISGFTADIPAGTGVELRIQAGNPTAGTYSGFQVDNYYKDDGIVDTGSDGIGVTVRWSGALGRLPTFSLGDEPVFPSFRDYVTVSSPFGPLQLSFTSPQPLTKSLGVLSITFARTVLPPAGDLRCIWSYSSTEYLASHCTLISNVITVIAPKEFDLPPSVTISLTITAINPNSEDGLDWSAGEGLYALDLSLDPSNTGVVSTWRTYIEVRPGGIGEMTVWFDHVTAGEPNRFRIVFRMSVPIPDYDVGNSRIVVEFPSAVFEKDLGLGADGGRVSCKPISGLVPKPPNVSISCYLQEGGNSSGQPIRVVITHFASIPAATPIEIHFDRVYNPVTPGDDQIATITLAVTSIASGWPGSRLAARTADFLYSVQSTPTIEALTSPTGIGLSANGVVGGVNGIYSVPVVSPSGGFQADDIVVVRIDPRVSMNTVNCGHPAVKSCMYYPGSNSVFLTMSGSNGDFSIDISEFRNSGYQLTSGLALQSFTVRSYRCISKTTYPASVIPFFTPHPLSNVSISRADGGVSNYRSDITDLKLTFTTSLYLSHSSAIVIELPIGTTAADVNCYNFPESFSQLVGVIDCKWTPQQFTVTNFNDLPPAANVSLLLNVKNSDIAGTYSVAVTTILTAGDLGQIVEAGTASFAISSSAAPGYHEIPLQFHINHEVRAGSVGPFAVIITFDTPITETDSIIVSFEDFPHIAAAQGGDLVCFLGDVLCNVCEMVGKTVKMGVSVSDSVPVGTYMLKITTKNADDYQSNGLLFPASPGVYQLTITYSSYYAQDSFPLLPSLQFSTLSIVPGQVSINSWNSFTVRLTTSAATDRLSICFPTKDIAGNRLFEDDLGSGVVDSGTFPCTTTGFHADCYLTYGRQSVARPACLGLSNFGVLTVGATLEIGIDRVRNPPVAVSDSKHVHITVSAYCSGQIVAAQTYYDVMTLSFAAPVSLSATNPASLCAYKPSLTLQFPSACQPTDTCVTELPSEVSLIGASCGSNCVIHTESRWVFLTPTSAITSLTVNLSANAVQYVSLTMVARWMQWRTNSYNMVVSVQEGTIAIPASFDRRNSLKTGPVYAYALSSFPQASSVWFDLTYTIADFLPTSACIQFVFPPSVSIVSPQCYVNGDSTSDFYSLVTNPNGQCQVASPVLLKVQGFSSLALGSVVSIRVAISTLSLSIGSVKEVAFQSYFDSQCTLWVESDIGTNTNSGYVVDPTLRTPTTLVLDKGLTAKVTRSRGENAVLKFSFTPASALKVGSGTRLELEFSDSLTVPAGMRLLCDLAETINKVRTAIDCSLAGTVLTVVPSLTLDPVSTYEITAYTQGIEGKNGLTLPAAATVSTVIFRTYNLSAATFAEFCEVKLSLPQSVLSDLQITPLHATLNEMTMLSVTFTSTTIVTKNYNVVVEFPCQSEHTPPVPLFDDCLGTGLSEGSSLPCMSWTPRQLVSNSYVTCQLSCGKCPFVTPRVKTTMTLSLGMIVNFSVLGVYNPNVAATDVDRAIVHMRVYIEDQSTGEVVAEGTVWNLYSVDNLPPTPFTSLSAYLSTSFGATSSAPMYVSMSPSSSTYTNYLLYSRDIVLANSCSTTKCGFQGNGVAWVQISTIGSFVAAYAVPWLNAAQGTLDSFIAIGRRYSLPYQQFALCKGSSIPLSQLSSQSISLNQFLSLYRASTWQFTRLFFNHPSAYFPNSTVRVRLLSGVDSANHSDNDEESLELTEGWPTSAKWKYDYAGKCFVVFGYGAISSGTRLGMRLLVRTSSSTINYFTVSVSTSTGAQYAYGSNSVSLSEDPIGGFLKNPTLAFTGTSIEIYFAVNWIIDDLQCAAGITRVNLMDRPFGINIWSSSTLTSCYYNGVPCEGCTVYNRFASGETVLMMGSSSIAAGQPVTLTMKTIPTPTPGWHSLGIVVEHNSWTFWNATAPTPDYCYLATYGSGCRNITSYAYLCSPLPCSSSTYWFPEPMDAVSLIFTKIPMPSIASFSTSPYGKNLNSISGLTISGSLPTLLRPFDLLRFSFEGAKFPPSLGLNPGDLVPFTDTFGTFSECWVEGSCTPTISGLYIPAGGTLTCGYAAVWCQMASGAAATSQFELNLLYLYAASMWSSPGIALKKYTYSLGGYTLAAESALKYLPVYSGGSTVTTPITVGLTDTTVSAVNSVNFGFARGMDAGDVILISLGYLYGYVSTALPTPPLLLTYQLVQSGVICPCLLATATSIISPLGVTVSIPGVTNFPYEGAQPSFFAIQHLKGSQSTVSYLFSLTPTVAGTLGNPTITVKKPPLYPNQGAFFSIAFEVVQPLPGNSVIEIDIQMGTFQSVSSFAASTNIPGTLVKFVTSLSPPSTYQMIITGNSVILPAHTLVLISNLWGRVSTTSPGTSIVTLQTYTPTPKSQIHSPATTSISLTETLFYLSPYNVLIPPNYRGGEVTPNGSNDRGTLTLYVQIPTLFRMSNGSTSPGYVQLSFQSGAFATGSGTLYGLFYDYISNRGYYSCGVAVTSTSIQVTIPLRTSFVAGALLRVEIGYYNGGVGIVMSPNVLVDVEVKDSGLFVINHYYQPQLLFPIGTRFSSLSVNPSGINSSLETYLSITFQHSATLTTDSEIVLEFPLIDFSSKAAIFTANLGLVATEGGLVPCALAKNSVPINSVFCRFYPGSDVSDVSKLRKPARIVLFGASIDAGATTKLIVGGFANPASPLLRTDLALFVRYKWTTSHIARGDGVYLYANYAYMRPFMTTISQPSTSGTDQYQTGLSSPFVTAKSVSWQLANASGVSEFDFVVFKLPPMLSISASSSVTLSSSTSTVYLIPLFGYIILVPDVSVSTGLTVQFAFTNISNPPYLASTWSLADIAVTSVFYSRAFHVRTTLYTDNAPGQPYSAIATLLPTLTTLNNVLSTNYATKHTFSIVVPIQLPASGVIDVRLPSGYQQVGPCQANIGGFAIASSCGVSGGTWSLQSFSATVPEATTITVFGWCTSPLTPGTHTGSVSIWADSGRSRNMMTGSYTTAGFVADNRAQDPDKMTVVPLCLSQELVRNREFGPVSVVFSPLSLLSKASGMVTLRPDSQFVYVPGSSHLVCKYIDMSTGVEYRAGKCDYSSGGYQIAAPPNTDLQPTKKYGIRLYTTGRDPAFSPNGLQFPDLTVASTVLWTGTVTESGNEISAFADLMRIYPDYTSFSRLKVSTISRHVSDASTLIIDVDFAINPGDEPAIVFPAVLFPRNLGQNTGFHSISGCDFSPKLTDSVTAGPCVCRLTPDLYTNMSDRSGKVQLKSAISASGLHRYYIPRVANPAALGTDVWLMAAVYRYTAGYEGLVHFGAAFNLFRTIAAGAAAISSENSITVSLGSLFVGDTADSILTITAGIAGNSYILFSFPVGISPLTAITSQVANYSPYQLLAYTGLGGKAAGFGWVVSGLVNPLGEGMYADAQAGIYVNGVCERKVLFQVDARPYVKRIGSVSGTVGTYDSGIPTQGMPSLVSLTLTSSQATPYGGGFLVSFPTAPVQYCLATTLFLTDFTVCQANNSQFSLKLYKEIPAGTSITLQFTINTTAASVNITVKSYADAGLWSNLISQGGISLSLISKPLISNVAAISPVQRRKSVRKTDISPLVFRLKFSDSLLSGLGRLDIVLPSSSFSIGPSPVALRCAWLSPASIYLSQSCSYSSITSLVSASPPETTNIASNVDWTLIVTTINQTIKDGLITLASFRCGHYWAYATAYAGLAATEYGGAEVTILPSDFATGKITLFSVSSGEITGLKVSFGVAGTVTSGLEAGGTSEIVVQFGPKASVFPVSLGGEANIGGRNYGETDCFAGNPVLSGLRCYLKNGDAAGSPQVWVRRFAAFGGGPEARVTIAPYRNPAQPGVICHFRLFARYYSLSDSAWAYTQYRDFSYLYMTEATLAAVKSGGVLSYSDKRPHSVSSLSVTIEPSRLLSPGGSDAVFLHLASKSNAISTASTSIHTITPLAVNYMYLIEPVTALPAGQASILPIAGVPTPWYCLSKAWTAYIVAGQATTDIISYAPIDCDDWDISADLRIGRIADANVPKHILGRTDMYVVYFKPKTTALDGGEVVITAPSDSQFVGGTCRVEHGLTGYVACVGDGTKVSISGFDQYTFTPTTAYITISVYLKANTVPATPSFIALTIYGVKGDASSHAETGFVPSPEVTPPPVPSQLAATIPKLYWERHCGYLSGYSSLTLHLTPSTPYPYRTTIRIEPPQGSSLTLGQTVVECSVSNGVNTVPSEGGCVFDPSFAITLSVPEQLPLAPGAHYSLQFTVRDSGDLQTNGIRLPSASDMSPSSGNPSLLYWFYRSQYGGSVVELAKFGCDVCGKPFSSVAVVPGHSLANEWNFFDFSFAIDTAVLGGGSVLLKFETHTGTAPLFEVDLGRGGGESRVAVDCVAIAGFALPGASPVSCSFTPAKSQSVSAPVSLQIYGPVAVGVTNTVRIPKVKNPKIDCESVFNQKLVSHFRADFQSKLGFVANQGVAYRVFSPNPLYTAPSPQDLIADFQLTGPPPLPVTPGTVINAPYSLEYAFQATSATTIGVFTGFILFQFPADFTIPTSGTATGVVCSGFATCVLSTHGLERWAVLSVTAGSETPTVGVVVRLAGVALPKTAKKDGYLVTAGVLAGNQIWTDTYLATMASVQMRTAPSPTITQLYSPPNRNTYSLYQISIDMTGVETDTKRVDFLFPREFQWVDSLCRGYSGIVPGLSFVCKSDCDIEVCSKRVSISDFYLSPKQSSFSFSIGAMSPSIEGETSALQVYYYSSSTDTSLVVQQTVAGGTFTINHPTYPFNIWVEWPIIDLYSRAVGVGGVGDVIIRILNSEAIPAAGGVLTVDLSSKITVRPQGVPSCSVAYGDQPLDNLPMLDGSIEGNGLVASQACTWDNSTITIQFPAAVLRNWYGVGPRCTWAVLTTTGGKPGNGFLLTGIIVPKEPDLVDTNFTVVSDPVAPAPTNRTSAVTDLEVVGLVSDLAAYSLFTVSFTVRENLSRGYPYISPQGLWGVQSVIEVQFSTVESFTIDLSTGLTTGDLIPCYIESGINPMGEMLDCRLERGDPLTLSPAVVTVRGYEEVEKGTKVAFCFPKLRNPTYLHQTAKVTVGVYNETHTGGLSWVSQPTNREVYNVTGRVAPEMKVFRAGGPGGYRDGGVRLRLELTYDLRRGDFIVIDFPRQFGNMTNALNGALLDDSALTPIYPVLPIHVYPLVQRVVATLPGRLFNTSVYHIDITGLGTPVCLNETSGVDYFTVSGQVKRDEFRLGEVLGGDCGTPLTARAEGPFGYMYRVVFSRNVTKTFVDTDFLLTAEPPMPIEWKVAHSNNLTLEVSGGPWHSTTSLTITFLTDIHDDLYHSPLSTKQLIVPPPQDPLINATFILDENIATSTGGTVLAVGGSVLIAGASVGGGSLAMSLLSQMQYFSYISTANYTMTGSMGSFYASLNQKSVLPNLYGRTRGVTKKRALLENGMEIINPDDFLDNCGQFLTILTVLVAIHALTFLVHRLAQLHCVSSFYQKFRWNFYLYFWYFAYLDFQVAALLQLADYGYTAETSRLFLCTFFASLTLFAAVPTPFLLYWFIRKHSGMLFDPLNNPLKQRYSMLASSLRSDLSRAKYLYPVYYFQRLIYSFLIVFMRGMEVYQAVVLIIPCFLMVVFVVISRPMLTKPMRIFHCLAEIDALIVFVLLCFLTLKFSTPQIDICWVIVGFTFKSVACTGIVTVVGVTAKLIQRCKDRKRMREVRTSPNLTGVEDGKGTEWQTHSKRPFEDFKVMIAGGKAGVAMETDDSEMESPQLTWGHSGPPSRENRYRE